ncbi:hypothetical protein OROHE_007099 [Orobanche hederae]
MSDNEEFNWRYVAEQFVKNLPDKVIVHQKEVWEDRKDFLMDDEDVACAIHQG